MLFLLQMLSLDFIAPADVLFCHGQALEEEAAAEALHATNPPLMEQLVLRHVRLKGTRSEREWERTSGISEAPILWHVLAQMLAGTSMWLISDTSWLTVMTSVLLATQGTRHLINMEPCQARQYSCRSIGRFPLQMRVPRQRIRRQQASGQQCGGVILRLLSPATAATLSNAGNLSGQRSLV